MVKSRPRVPIGLPIAATILFILGLVAGPIIRSTFSERELATNVLLSAIPFILIFVAIILLFISAIWLLGSVLNHTISAQVYRPVETIIIAGIVLGVFGMFQPWFFALYKYGFFLLLVSTLAFIVWSHIMPYRQQRVQEEELGTVSVAEIQQ